MRIVTVYHCNPRRRFSREAPVGQVSIAVAPGRSRALNELDALTRSIRPSDDSQMSLVRERGYASITREGDRSGSLAVAIPAREGPPLAALAIHGPSSALSARETELLELLRGTATRLAHRASTAA
jgi:DNA-binding IclR family transcriptional regulator